MDGRLWPEDFFQLHKGGSPPSRYHHIPTQAQFTDIRTPVESAVVRNAGGRASDAIRSLVTLDSLLPLGTIIVIHHTGNFPRPNYITGISCPRCPARSDVISLR